MYIFKGEYKTNKDYIIILCIYISSIIISYIMFNININTFTFFKKIKI